MPFKFLIGNWLFKDVPALAKAVRTEINNVYQTALCRQDGATSTFTTADGKTVTVKDGQIIGVK